MRYAYRCDGCGFEADAWFPLGQAPETTDCLAFYSEWACVGTSHRVYTPLVTPAFKGSHKAEYGKS